MHNPATAALARIPGYIEGRKPRNIVTRTGSRNRGILHCEEFGSLLWESPIERTMLKAMCLSPTVECLLVQPAVFEITLFDGTTTTYTPDAAAFVNRSLVIFEAKADNQARHPVIAERLQAIKHHFQLAGVAYVVFTDKQFNDKYEARLDTLWRHRKYFGRCDQRRPLMKRAQQAAQTKPTLRSYVDAVGDLHAAMHALATRHAFIDFAQPINDDAIVFPSYEAQHDSIARHI